MTDKIEKNISEREKALNNLDFDLEVLI